MSLKLEKLYALIKQFGLIFSVKYCLYKFMKKDEKYIDLLCSYLKKFEQPLIDKYNSMTTKDNITQMKDKVPVWVCWFQGEENMPELCKINYRQLKKMLPENAELHLITLDNYKQYADIPNFIMEKVMRGKITYTQLSDILRWTLLARWGGLWIDSTVYCAKEIDEEFLLNPAFWSIRLDKIDDPNCIGQVISNCQWSGFMLKDRSNSLLVKYVLDATLLYWEKHDTIIDYFLQNLLLKVAYENIESIKETIDNLNLNNKNVYDLHVIMDKGFEQEKFDSIVKDTTFFKLTWKQKYKKITDEGKETFYGFLTRLDLEDTE